MRTILFQFLLIFLVIACAPKPKAPTVDPGLFSKTVDGKQVKLYTIQNQAGMELTVTNYGGRIVSWLVPDKNGKFEDVVFGHDSIDGYLNAKENYFGASIGRYGNRIANGEFMLGDIRYKLAQNNGPNSLHGGVKGFSAKIWDVVQTGTNELQLKLVSPDMDEGYPGELKVTMTYKLTNDNALFIQYAARCDKPTIINLTNHSYFNLHGAGNGSILDHLLMINADSITPIDSTLIPTGQLMAVGNTPFDFRTPTAIGARIDVDHPQIKFGKGYDMNFVLNKAEEQPVTLAASVFEPASGRMLEVLTDQPGVQFYTGNFLDGAYPGKKGRFYGYRTGFCLETQHFPNSPNQPGFPSVVLNPGEDYNHTCVYRFSVKK